MDSLVLTLPVDRDAPQPARDSLDSSITRLPVVSRRSRPIDNAKCSIGCERPAALCQRYDGSFRRQNGARVYYRVWQVNFRKPELTWRLHPEENR